MTVNAPSLLRGTVIARSAVRFAGVADYAELEYDEAILTRLMVEIGQYRLSSSIRRSELRGSVHR